MSAATYQDKIETAFKRLEGHSFNAAGWPGNEKTLIFTSTEEGIRITFDVARIKNPRRVLTNAELMKKLIADLKEGGLNEVTVTKEGPPKLTLTLPNTLDSVIALNTAFRKARTKEALAEIRDNVEFANSLNEKRKKEAPKVKEAAKEKGYDIKCDNIVNGFIYEGEILGRRLIADAIKQAENRYLNFLTPQERVVAEQEIINALNPKKREANLN